MTTLSIGAIAVLDVTPAMAPLIKCINSFEVEFLFDIIINNKLF